MELDECLSVFRSDYDACPGKYCSRVLLNDTLCLFSQCQKCPRGYRPAYIDDSLSICKLCTNELGLYDYMFLIFMLNLSVVLNLVYIDGLFEEAKKLETNFKFFMSGLLYASPILENVLALLLSILLFTPIGSLHLNSCSIYSFYDWYSIFFDPYVDYYNKLNCSQEVVYPLYSLLILFFLLSTIIMLVLRIIIFKSIIKDNNFKIIISKSSFASLHFLPILILVHLVVGGVIYYSFPYITIISLLISNNIHLSRFFEFKSYQRNSLLKNIKSTFRLLKVPRNMIVMLIHWYFFLFGIVSLTEFDNGFYDIFYIILMPGPLLFFVLSFKYTNPKNF